MMREPGAPGLLEQLRSWASENAAALTPACTDRYDGAERRPADPDAVAEKQMFDLVLVLVEAVGRDVALLGRAAELVKKRRG